MLKKNSGHHHAGLYAVSGCALHDIPSVTVPQFADMVFWIFLSAQRFQSQTAPGARGVIKWEWELQSLSL